MKKSLHSFIENYYEHLGGTISVIGSPIIKKTKYFNFKLFIYYVPGLFLYNWWVNDFSTGKLVESLLCLNPGKHWKIIYNNFLLIEIEILEIEIIYLFIIMSFFPRKVGRLIFAKILT